MSKSFNCPATNLNQTFNFVTFKTGEQSTRSVRADLVTGFESYGENSCYVYYGTATGDDYFQAQHPEADAINMVQEALKPAI